MVKVTIQIGSTIPVIVPGMYKRTKLTEYEDSFSSASQLGEQFHYL